jgi:DnaJ-class molecular chaperone
MKPDEMREMFGGQDPFSDFFHTFFGGQVDPEDAGRRGRAGRARASRHGRDVESEITLSLEEAFQGTTRQLSIKTEGHARTVPVRIPAGVSDGSRVRVSGEGEHGTGGAQSGDLYLRVVVRAHASFERKGDDLATTVKVPLSTLVLGGEASVPTLDGSLSVKVPPGTAVGQTLRLRGQGLPELGKVQDRGDILATLAVEIPKTLQARQKELFDELKASGL